MPANNKYHISRLLKISVITILFAGILVITVAAIGNGEKEKISNVKISIGSTLDHPFVTKTDIMQALVKANGKSLKNQSVESLNLAKLEKNLMNNRWVRKAELFIDNNKTLRVNVEESIPVARVFTTDGKSFYVSTSSGILPLSDRYSARVPAFTDFPAFKNKPDSTLLMNVFTLGSYILNDGFWMAQIDQVTIMGNDKFEMIPKLGNQIIRFGNSDDYAEKFRKLLAFYNQVQFYTGWNRYSVIDVQYKGQIVATRRDAAEIKADSLASIRIMKNIIENAKKDVNDSTRIQLPENEIAEKPRLRINPKKDNSVPPLPASVSTEPITTDNPQSFSVPEKEEPDAATKPEVKPTVKKETVKKAPVKKEEVKKEKAEKRVPKAVMPSKKSNDEHN